MTQGCNIRDIDVVVQWKVPGTLSNFIQRAGRAARGSDRRGLAVLLVEPSVYSIILSETITGKQRRKRGRRKGKGKQAAAGEGEFDVEKATKDSKISNDNPLFSELCVLSGCHLL